MSASKFFNGIDLQNQKAVNVADPSSGTDAANKQYVDNLAAGLSWKKAVRVASTTNGTLATAYAVGSSVDGVTLATGDRILLRVQTAGAENGIYTVNATGAPTRATDADTAAELKGATVLVTEGTVNADKAFTQTVDTITVDTTALVWAQFGAGQSYTAANGLQLTANAFSVLAEDTTISVSPLGIKTSRAAIGATGKYAADVGALTAGTPLTITHGLNSLDVAVQCHLNSTGEIVDLGAIVTGVNTVTVQAASSQTASAFRIVVTG